MRKILELVPWFLLYSRLFTAILFLVLSFWPNGYDNLQNLVLFLFCFGFIGDILDGIIARALKMDTTLMRRLDSLFDLGFWLTSTYLIYAFVDIDTFVLVIGFTSVITLVAIEYVISIIRFSKPPSSHNTMSKFFGLMLFGYYTLCFSGINANIYGIIAFSFGFIARLDALIIYSTLKTWSHDIPSFYHAQLINKNIPFKKNKLFHSEHV